MTIRMKIARGAVGTFAAIGLGATILLAAGLALDVMAFDTTAGGYEPPYTDYTGTPIDWSAMDVTPTGMASRGHFVNVLVDCTSGMITLEAFKLQVPFRPLSPRAVAVHKPREACRERGFMPEF